ncbi:MAG: T9SS type A sorting domain-containing protein [Bacteroidales bacterium]|nr:T9SS type A sorting domain-containing protein [Bacteroidales bacterium]
MKTNLIIVAIFAMLSGFSLVTDANIYWVSTNGGATWANAKSKTPLSGTSACSMATANTNAAAGDTVYLRGGTYGTGLAPANSGNSTNRILFKAYNGEIPKITGTNNAISVQGKSYITIDGINADGNKVFANMRTTNHVWLINCTLINSTDTGGWPTGIHLTTNAQYNRIANCIIGGSGYMTSNDDIGGLISVGAWDVANDNTSYNLIENNTFYHGGHHVMEIAAKYNIIRNNTFHNEDWTSCNRPSTGNLCGNRNIGIYDDVPSNCFWNVIEGNKIAFSGASIDDSGGGSGISVRSPNMIVRNNLCFLNEGPGMAFYADGTGNYDSRYCRVYHNVFYKNAWLSINEYRYKFGFVFDNVAGNNPAIPIVSNALKNNLFYLNTSGDMYFYYTNYALQTILGNYYATASYNSTPLAAIAGNTVSTANPKFVNISFPENVANIDNFDFHLQSTSPAINIGAFLTTTTSAGSGTIIPVADASYFIDGFGITNGDIIQLQGQIETAQITSINYSTNNITIDKSLTWTSGLGVSMAYSGTAPDAGAYEYITPTSQQKIENIINNFTIYPNPFSESATIDFSNINKLSGGDLSFHLYNLLGKEVTVFTNISTDKLILEKKNLAEGMYLYKVMLNEKFIGSGKLVVQ